MQQSIDLVDCKACAYANVDARAWYSSISLRLGAGAAVERRSASPLLRQNGIRHDHAAAAADAARRAPAAADAVAGRAASQGPAAPPQPRRRRVLRRRCRSHRPRECPSDVATALQTGPDLTGRRTRLAALSRRRGCVPTPSARAGVGFGRSAVGYSTGLPTTRDGDVGWTEIGPLRLLLLVLA